MPHGHCYLWTPSILWLHVISDFIIFISYYSIPIALIYFVVKKKTVPFNWIFWMFGAFILLCGTTHIVDVWTTWNPTYRLEGVIKAITALVSIATAITLWPLIPKAMALPTTYDLQEINRELEKSSEKIKAEKERAETVLRNLEESQNALRKKTADMEKFNQLMVGREDRVIELKKQVNELSKALGRPAPYGLAGKE